MPYRVGRDEQNVPRIALADEPAYCHALAASVPALEPELGRGVWLVMAFAAWSVPDVRAVEVALDLARHFGGRLKLGLRPYDDSLEVRTWWPGADTEASGPFWVLLRDGSVVGHRVGHLSASELAQWAAPTIAQELPPT